MKRYRRECMFCGGVAVVLAPDGSDDLDVEAEFAAAGRAFGDEDELAGVGCYPCSRKRWRAEDIAWNREIEAERRHLAELVA